MSAVCFILLFVYLCSHADLLDFMCLSIHIQEATLPLLLSPLRGFEHLTASYLLLPSHRHRQALPWRCMRHLYWHSPARSQVSRHCMRRWPNLWTSYCFTRNPYTNSTSACRDFLVTTPQTSLLTALERSELPKHEPEIRLLQYIYLHVHIYMYLHSKRVLTYPTCVM